MTQRISAARFVFAGLVLWLGTASPASAAFIGASPPSDHPTAAIVIKGAKFAAKEPIDIYFDTTDELLVVANRIGGFNNRKLAVPADALPGTHWITAIGRQSGDTAQRSFTVSTDWAQFHFTQLREGANPYENVLSPYNVSALNTAWVAATGGSISSSPAVVNGVAYVGSSDGNLYAFNAITGAQLWTVPSTKAIYSSPAVANGAVYFGSSDGVVYAYNATTGNAVWAVSTGLESQVNASPAVTNGVVYVGTQTSGSTGDVYALNASTGATLWTSAAGGAISSSPAVANGIVYFPASDGVLYAYAATNGNVLWAQGPGPAYHLSSPAVANGIVYVGTEGPDGTGYLLAFNASTGAVQWTAPTGGAEISSPAVANGVVYVGSDDDKLYAFNAATGAQVWTATAGGAVQSSPAVANGVVYVGCFDGHLYAFDVATGTTLWTAAAGSFIDSSPAVANGMVYVGSNDPNLHAYALNGGNNSVYRTKRMPPKIPTLEPDWRLKPQH